MLGISTHRRCHAATRSHRVIRRHGPPVYGCWGTEGTGVGETQAPGGQRCSGLGGGPGVTSVLNPLGSRELWPNPSSGPVGGASTPS